jgi:glycosyltransferase involved in cell wall biosynthesis
MTAGNICVGAFHKVWYRVRPTIETHGAVEPVQKSAALRKNVTGVYIGRLAKDVGIMAYLEALQILQKQAKHVELDVYGDGPQRSEAELFVKSHGLCVRFYGNVPNAAQYLPSYSFACVSQYLAILESFTAQTPIIAQYHNEMKHDYLRLAPFAEWVKSAQTPAEIAEHISLILAQPDSSRAQVQHGKAWADTQTWQNMTNVYENLWNGKT